MQLTSIKKISYVQLAVLLVASRLFSEAMSFPLANTEYGMQRFTVILTAYLILFVQYIPLIYISKKYSGESAFGLLADRFKILGLIYAAVLTLSVLISSLSSMCRMKFYASSTIFGQAPDYLLIILPLLACAFTVFKGAQAAARSGVIFAAVFVAFLILISVSTWSLFDPKWLYPSFIDSESGFWAEVWEQVGSNSEIIFFAVLTEHVSEKSQRAVYWYVPAVMLLLELMHLLEMLVLGPFLGSANFPFFTVSALSNIVLFQRLDGIDVAVWTLMCIVKISLAMLCIRTIFNRLAGERAGIAAALSGVAVIAAAAILFGGSSDFAEAVTGILTCGVPMIICGIIFPLISIITARLRPNKNGKGGNTDEKAA
ncbi:MAG: spore germination protein [Bacteroides sp.]|nr:spore germination protein [Bacteroides sp.]